MRKSPLAKIANGTRVEKIANEDGGAHPVGATGTVLGSVGLPDVGVAYFIEFDLTPSKAVLNVESKIAAIAAGALKSAASASAGHLGISTATKVGNQPVPN